MMKPILNGDRFTLQSGDLKAELLTPWSRDYQRTRFAHCGFITGLWLGDVCFTQAELAQVGQASTGGVGLCSEYKCPSIEMDSEVGEDYLKIGAGVIKRPAEPWKLVDEQLISGLPATVVASEDTAVFECISPKVNGYAYREKRTVSLNGHVLRQEIELENTGDKLIDITEYCHNFVSLGGIETDETHHLTLHCARKLPSSSAQFVATDSGAGWTGKVEGSFSAPCEIIPGLHPCAWKLESDRTSVSIAEMIDFAPSSAYLWGTSYCVSAEIFNAIRIQPGETARWSREWHVGV